MKSDAVAVIASVPKAVQVAGIELDDLSGFIVGDVDEMLGEQLAGVRPVGVRVRIVAFEHDVVDADTVPLLDAGLIRNEAAVYVFSKQLGGKLVGVDVAPVLMSAPGVVDAVP